ncbi:hypothetical protein [Paenibacillus thailandensis]|uniref:Uncharacterized protein n=1 Tax=Paenibacillus thailandensis TaxID=393250 RepID=A0ABW5R199_9BACL
MDRSKGKAEGPAAKEASDPDLEGNPEADSFGAEWTSPSTKNLSHMMRQVLCCFRMGKTIGSGTYLFYRFKHIHSE